MKHTFEYYSSRYNRLQGRNTKNGRILAKLRRRMRAIMDRSF